MAKRVRDESVVSTVEEDTNESSAKSRSQSAEPEVHTPKFTSLESATAPETPMIRCVLPPHKLLSFATYAEYEAHYNQAHTNRCAECRKNFPTSHFLDLHIADNHDPIVAAKREAGEKTYGCFVEGCEKVCGEWKKRRRHLVDKHGYPKNYDFLVVNNGIDGRRSMLRPGIDAQGHRKSSRERGRRSSSSTEATEATEAILLSEVNGDAPAEPVQAESIERKKEVKVQSKGSNENAGVDDLTSSMSALKMVPRSITFGKRKGRSGFAKS